MKNIMFWALSVALAVCALTFLTPDAYAASAILPHVGHALGVPSALAAVVLAVGLDALKRQHADLTGSAAAKLAEVKDGLSAEEVRAIETAHGEIVRDLATVSGALQVEERIAKASPPPPPAAVTDDKAERTRAAEVATLATKYAMPADFAARHIADGTSLDEVRRLVLDEVGKRGTATRVSPHVTVTVDEQDTMRAAVETAILHRANPGAVQIAGDSPARQWRGMTSVLEMGRVYIEETTGVRLRHLNKRELAGAVLGLDTGARDGGGLSSSDFPNILANVINKRLRAAYDVAPQHWKRLGRESSAPDFKTKAVVQLSNAPNLPVIKEGGEYTYTALGDAKEQYALATYGRIIRLTRQSLINDDLSAFDRIPMLFGRSAAETEASVFWSIITANAALADTVALFHATHGNLAASGTAIDVANLSVARASMRKQKGLAKKAADAEPLNLLPAFLAVSPDKETEAQQVVAAIAPTQASTVNPFVGSLAVMAEARLSGNAWYLFADPATIDTIEYAYLEGENGLYTEQRFGWEVDGIEIKGRLDFAAKAIDYRGMYKNPGN